MAVFAWALGDPFNYEMDDQPFYDAVFDLPSDVFHGAADLRSSSQSITFDWGVSYTEWYGDWLGSIDTENPRNLPLMVLLSLGIPISFLPFGMISIAPYLSPWTAPAGLILDVYNIYRYFD